MSNNFSAILTITHSRRVPDPLRIARPSLTMLCPDTIVRMESHPSCPIAYQCITKEFANWFLRIAKYAPEDGGNLIDQVFGQLLHLECVLRDMEQAVLQEAECSNIRMDSSDMGELTLLLQCTMMTK